MSGGTDTHLMLVELRPITGREAADRLAGLSGITVNKNTVPFETRVLLLLLEFELEHQPLPHGA